MAGGYVYALLIFAMVGHSSGSWCVCKPGSDTVLQKTLDYACGHGADCNPTHQNGPCYNPNTVKDHCSYAVNSYYQKSGQNAQACDFAGTAMVVQNNPSSNGCSFPASASGSSGMGTPTTTVGTPSTTTGTPSTTTGTPGSTTPVVTTNSPTLSGMNNGLGPGPGTNTDISDGGISQPKIVINIMFILAMVSRLVFRWA